MHPNYRFLIDRVNGRVLDFGCGRGDFIQHALNAGIDCYGADVFYGGYGRDEAQARGLLGSRILEIQDSRLPFPSCHFDFVVSNFVFEHVEDLRSALAEIHRVLKPNGRLIALFPTKGAIREGHLELPIVHWIKPGPLRERYVRTLRRMGLGTKYPEEHDIPPDEWTSRKLDFLDRHTFYRTRREIVRLMRGFSVAYIEPDYLRFRLGLRLPGIISRLMGATVIDAAKITS